MIKKIIYFGLALMLVGCNTNTEKKELANLVLQDSLAFELCQMYGLDQGIRQREIFSGLDKEFAVKIDSINFVKFFDIIEKFGFPNKELLGEQNIKQDCVDGASKVILLHNPHRLIENKAYLNILLKEADKGNLKRKFIATVLDKYYWWKSGGEEVLYGSQFGMPCINSKEKTNILRKEIGMEPLADSLFIDCAKK